MKKQRTVLGLQGLVSGYTLLHRKYEAPDTSKPEAGPQPATKSLDTKPKA